MCAMRIPYPSHSSNIAGHYERLGHCNIQHWSDIPLPLLGHGLIALSSHISLHSWTSETNSIVTVRITVLVYCFEFGSDQIMIMDFARFYFKTCAATQYSIQGVILWYFIFLILTHIYLYRYIHFFLRMRWLILYECDIICQWDTICREQSSYYLQDIHLGNNPHTICRLLLPAENKCLSPWQILTIDGTTSSNTPKQFMEKNAEYPSKLRRWFPWSPQTWRPNSSTSRCGRWCRGSTWAAMPRCAMATGGSEV